MVHKLPELTFWRHTMGCLGLEVFAPLIIVILAYIIENIELHGSEAAIFKEISESYNYNLFSWIYDIVYNNFPDMQIMLILFGFYVFEYVLLMFTPSNEYQGPKTPTGFVPKYRDNALQCYLINLIAALLIYTYFCDYIPLHLLFYRSTSLIIGATIWGHIFTTYFYFKGRFASYWKSDLEITGNFIYDYYKGLEWYPTIFGANGKQLINSRIGMTQWALIVLFYVFAEYDKQFNGVSNISSGNYAAIYNFCINSPVFLSALLQILYLLKFFIWELGYFHTMDVQHDRCGFYISWGCTAWVPSVYTFHTGWLLSNYLNDTSVGSVYNILMRRQTPFVFALILALGVLSIYINYDCDIQRSYVRSKDGKCDIWFKPAKVIRTNYIDNAGKKRQSILLYSGYWGITRHFHYIPEILASLFWAVPTHLFSILPYFYVIYLTILLLDRAGRDDGRCRTKYGKYWEKYCKLVPYKVIPFVY